MSGPLVFDRNLLRRRRTRWACQARTVASGTDFLLARAAEDLGDRLETMARDFPLALEIGGHSGLVADRLAATGRIGSIIRMETVPALIRAGNVGVVADEELLPFAEQSLDLVVAPLSLQLVNDLPGTLIQIRRILKPDGLFLAAIAGGDTLTELRQATMAAEIERTGGASPRVAPFADIRSLGALMQRAGFALPVVDRDLVTVRYGNALTLMLELRAMGAGNVLIERDRKPMARGFMMRIAEIYAERFAAPDGRLPATFELISLAGWAPHPDQQRPLAPGSAKMRLADALKRNDSSD